MAGASPTSPVLAVLVCHDGEQWLPETLGALRALHRRPRWVVAVDTGSTDGTADLLAASNEVDVILPQERGTGFAEAVHAAVADADRRWGRAAEVAAAGRDPANSSGEWIWVLHDDAAPEPDCLDVLLRVAETSPAAAVLGPLCLDWDDPRLVVEAGLSIDSAGNRQTGIGGDELDLGQFATNSEVLAVGSAASLVRRREWDTLGGYDTAMGLLREDTDYGWRVNRAGGLVLCAPSARVRHARAVGTRRRGIDVDGVDRRLRAADRIQGLRTFLANCSTPAAALGAVRLPVLALVRALGLLLTRRPRAAGAELAAVSSLLLASDGRSDLTDARARRRAASSALPRELRGLLTSRITRLRNAIQGGLTSLVRGRLREELELGRLPDWAQRRAASAAEPDESRGARPVGPEALPAGAVPKRTSRRTAGLRRPGESLAVALASGAAAGEVAADGTPAPDDTATTPFRSPTAGGDPGTGQVVVVPVTPGRIARELLLAPPLLLAIGLTLVSLVAHRARLGTTLAGGRIAEVPGLGEAWSAYVAGWHPVAGGSGAPAPVTLGILGVLGALTAPLGGPAAAVSLLLLGALPLAGLSAYLATRELRVSRLVRALAAAVYALLGIVGGAVAQGRLDGVVAMILLPLVLSGVVAMVRGVRTSGRRTSWWSTAAGTALALAVISAFAPLVLVLVLIVVVVGFVLVPAPEGSEQRRTAALAVVVLGPVLLLMPWPILLLDSPQILLHGTGATVDETQVGVLSMLSLDPGGPGTLPWAGLVLLLLVVAAGFVAPRREAVPGLALIVLGIVAAGVVGSLARAPLAGGDPRPGWTGPALAVAACGALWSLLAQIAAARAAPIGTLVGRRERRSAPVRLGESELDLGGAGVAGRLSAAAERVGAVAAGAGARFGRRGDGRRTRSVAVPALTVAVTVLVVGTALGGGAGPLRDDPPPALSEELAAELTASGSTVVEITDDPDTTRRATPLLPRYGDDDIAPVGATPARLVRDVRALLTGDAATVQAAVAEFATAGTGALVLPDDAAATRVRAEAGPLLTDGGTTTDGRPVAKVALPTAGAVVLEPPISDDAVEGRAAPRRPSGIVAVGATPDGSGLPTVGLQVSPGADRRLLVVAAEQESGWSATVGGAPAEVVTAWGHLVAVPLPAEGGPVVVDRDPTTRTLLLLMQLALVLFTALSALPSRTRLE